MIRVKVPRSRRSQLLIEMSLYVSATRSIQQYPLANAAKNFHASCLYVSGIFVMTLMAAIKSTISADGFVVSIDMTSFGLLGGTVKIALIMSSNLLLDILRVPPSAVAVLNGTGDSGYSITFS